MPAIANSTPMLPGLSPIHGRPIEARFDGALLSSDGGLLALREVEQRLGVARRLAGCLRDPRAPERVLHGLDEIIRFRMLMIAAGYEDGNDADALRGDPMFKLAMERLPDHADLCSQSTIYCTPEVLRFCRAERLDYTLGVAPTTTLRKHIAALEQSTVARAAAAGDEKLRRFKEFHDGAASWDRVERIVARIEAGPRGVDTRFIVTSLGGGSARTLYQDIYCARGQAENHIKAWKTHLAADRTSCCRASANQMRLFLHVGAYWLMWSLRALMPRRSSWRVAQLDTLRLRLIKLAARVEVLKRKVRLHLPQATPDQAIFAHALARMPRLIV